MPRVKLIPWGVILNAPDPPRKRPRRMTVRIWSPPFDADAAKRNAEDTYGGEALAAQPGVPPLCN